MVGWMWPLIALMLGFASYLAIGFLGAAGTVRLRERVANHYWGLATRAWGKMTLVRRKVGGLNLETMKLDDEKGAGKVVLDSSVIGSEKGLYYDDPDNRMGRINGKPLAMIHEEVNGCVDPQLAELGRAWREHYSDGKHMTDGGAVNPYFDLDADTRLVNLDDVIPLILNDSAPTDVDTTEAFTRKRFEKYKNNVGAKEVLTTFTGFGVGLGGIVIAAWVRSEMLDGGTSTPENPVPVWITTQLADGLVALSSLGVPLA